MKSTLIFRHFIIKSYNSDTLIQNLQFNILHGIKEIIRNNICCNIMLNSVRQHNCFITQSNYIGYMFRLLVSHLQAYFNRFSHKMLGTHWIQACLHQRNTNDLVFCIPLMYSTLGSQCVHSIL